MPSPGTRRVTDIDNCCTLDGNTKNVVEVADFPLAQIRAVSRRVERHTHTDKELCV